MFRKIKFQKNSMSAVIAAVLYAVCLTVFTRCSLDGSIESLRQKATGNCSHVWGEYKQITAPTCTVEGKETRYCQLNSAHTQTQAVKALGHNWGPWKDSTATCTERGYVTRYCARDNSHTERDTANALGHNFRVVSTTATCLYDGYDTERCTRCNITREMYAYALGHDWGQWIVITPATATRTGIERRTCYRYGCNAFETRETPKTSP